MNNKYLLAICIPAYNREVYLKRLLDSIVNQEGFTDEVCIVINDGPSMDNTTEMVAIYQKKYKNIFYSRNAVAVGMLPAILESIDMSIGQYTWLFGSDDFMHENALEMVLDIIKSKSPKIVLSNRVTLLDNQEHRAEIDKQNKVYCFHGFSDFGTYLGVDDEDLYRDKWNYLTFMSIFCFETKHYRDMLAYVADNICTLEDLKKHYFNYIVILFSQLYSESKICLIEAPRLVYCQGGNTSWKPNHKINIDIKMLMNYLKHQYSLTDGCKKLFRRIYLESVIYGNFIYKIQNISLFRNLVGSLMKNKYTKKLYFQCIKILSGSR